MSVITGLLKSNKLADIDGQGGEAGQGAVLAFEQCIYGVPPIVSAEISTPGPLVPVYGARRGAVAVSA